MNTSALVFMWSKVLDINCMRIHSVCQEGRKEAADASMAPQEYQEHISFLAGQSCGLAPHQGVVLGAKAHPPLLGMPLLPGWECSVRIISTCTLIT